MVKIVELKRLIRKHRTRNSIKDSVSSQWMNDMNRLRMDFCCWLEEEFAEELLPCFWARRLDRDRRFCTAGIVSIAVMCVCARSASVEFKWKRQEGSGQSNFEEAGPT
mmetsp:Transcript_2364/g.4277  ORF Transcript_2364/g.4277 Transcript_2364/m.4277 type:complete len:108 (+) Transcript_2364:2813-3136(+)